MAKVVEQQEAVRKHRFTVEEFHKMGEAGIFHEDDRVELIDGEVLEMPPIGWRHAWCVRQLIRILAAFAGDRTDTRYEVDAQNPFALGEHGEPQPDLVLLRDPPTGRLPRPEEIALVVEVADSSLNYDRNIKLPRYAAAGILEAWLVDLNVDRIEVHSDPESGRYRRTLRFARGEQVQSAAISGLTFDAGEILPPREEGSEG